MSAIEKHAWFNVAVIAVALIGVGSLYPFLGNAAHGALGICGLLGFGPLFYRKRDQEIVLDERAILIQQRSALLGYAIFWVIFVVTASLLSVFFYGMDGSVPVQVIQLSVFYAFALFIGAMSLAVLVFHRRG